MSRKRLDDDVFAQLVDRRPRQRVGVEQEFRVSREGSQLPFARWSDAGLLPGRRLDPIDPHAHRQPNGGVLTVDGLEAEVATPPAQLAPDFTTALQASISDLRHDLAKTATDTQISGVSTHLNLEVPDHQVVAVARQFARRHSGALMLLMDRIDSPGLLVRPRAGRLELGAEYAVGAQLTAAMVFAAAAAAECRGTPSTPPPATPVLQPATLRYGWYVDRCGYGVDLYRHGRRTRGSSWTGQDLLRWSWDRVRPCAEQVASAAEIEIVDATIDGRLPLPCEHPDDEPAPRPLRGAESLRDLTATVRVGDLCLTPFLMTWDHVVFRVTDGRRTMTLALPLDSAEGFVSGCVDGRFTSWVHQELDSSPERLPVLASVEEVGRGRVFSGVKDVAVLAARERTPGSGVPVSGGDSRRHKHDGDHPAPSSTARFGGGSRLVAGAVALLVVLAGAFGTVVAVRKHQAHVAERRAAALAGERAAAITAANRKVQALAGSYSVLLTVTKGSSSAPVGTTLRNRWRVTTACADSGACTVDIGSGPHPILGGRTRFTENVTQPCGPGQGPGTVSVRIDHDLLFRPDLVIGTLDLDAVDVTQCKNVTDEPITESVRAVRTG